MAEVLLGLLLFAEHRVDEPVNVVDPRVRGVERLREAEFLQRDVHLAALVIPGGELGVDLRALLRRRAFALDRGRVRRWRLWRRRLGRASGDRERGKQGEQGERRAALAHDRGPGVARISRRRRQLATATGIRVASLRFTRSCTLPARWPQAASMSSPRVLRIVATIPASCTVRANARMRSRGLVPNSLPGNGLNGIRLILQGPSRTSRTSSWACVAWSLTPSSITYSK